MIKKIIRIKYIALMILIIVTNCVNRSKMLYPEKGNYPRFFPNGIKKNEWLKNDNQQKFKEIKKNFFLNNRK